MPWCVEDEEILGHVDAEEAAGGGAEEEAAQRKRRAAAPRRGGGGERRRGRVEAGEGLCFSSFLVERGGDAFD